MKTILYNYSYRGKRDSVLDATITFNPDGSITTSGYHGESPTLLRHLDPVWWLYIHTQIMSSEAHTIFTQRVPISNYIRRVITGSSDDKWNQVNI